MVALTEKFEKELYKFMVWADNNYSLASEDNKPQDIDNKMLFKNLDMSNYVEPPRNKLEIFVKMIMKNYKIVSKETNNTIENYKTLVINFKNDKTTKKIQKKESKNEKNTNKIPIIDKTIDSSDFYWHETLDYPKIHTQQLIEIFGEPDYLYNKDSDSKNIWEWKISIGNNKYCIYDWRSEFFDDIEKHTYENMNNIIWNLEGESKKKIVADLKILMKFINKNSTKINFETEIQSKIQTENTNDKHLEEIENLEETEEIELDNINIENEQEYSTEDYLNETEEIDETHEIIENINNQTNKLINLSLSNLSLDEIEFDDY